MVGVGAGFEGLKIEIFKPFGDDIESEYFQSIVPNLFIKNSTISR